MDEVIRMYKKKQSQSDGEEPDIEFLPDDYNEDIVEEHPIKGEEKLIKGEQPGKQSVK